MGNQPRIIPHDEATTQTVGGSALVYRYERTTVWTFHQETEVESPDFPNLRMAVLQGEEINAVAVAEVTGNTFRVYWYPEPIEVQQVLNIGFRMRNQVVARALFQGLGQYRFVGEDDK